MQGDIVLWRSFYGRDCWRVGRLGYTYNDAICVQAYYAQTGSNSDQTTCYYLANIHNLNIPNGLVKISISVFGLGRLDATRIKPNVRLRLVDHSAEPLRSQVIGKEAVPSC